MTPEKPDSLIAIRPLDAVSDLELVVAAYQEARDYWSLADRKPPDRAKAAAFFTDHPPGSDPSRSHHLGLFAENQLVGLAELCFGFPQPQDAYLGLMILSPRCRGMGLGAAFLAHIEALALTGGARQLFLAVLQENPRGKAFWQREGFRPTGLTRHDAETGHLLHRLVKDL
jgi:GNAT superfamily N-acetyltransferase